ncbi:MAG: class I SAM-dependent methyltransferase [Chitinophagaceae bacterium]
MTATNIAFSGSIPANYERYLGPYIFEPYAQDIITHISHKQINNVLETACGTGRVSGLLRDVLPKQTSLVATDFNADMLHIAQQMHEGKNIEWLTADMQALPFPDDSFDLIICQFGLMFVPDKQKALNEAYRVLKTGGQLLLSTWNSLTHNPAFDLANKLIHEFFPSDPPAFFQLPFSLHNPTELQQWATNAGFNQPQITLVKKQGTSVSAAATATGMIEGSPVYTLICERDASLLPHIKKHFEKELAAQFGSAPMISPLEAWLLDARKCFY